MTPATPPIVSGKLPDIHVWMTLGEAADSLDTSVETIGLRVREGDLESRLNDDGDQQVLVCLPKKPAPAPAVEEDWVDRLLSDFPDGQRLAPMSKSPEWKRADIRPRTTRSARLAWAMAAVMFLVAGTGAVIAASIVSTARETSRDLSRKLEMVSLAANDLSTQRDQLRLQLSDAGAALEKVQGELAVDRSVEDTLFKAVQAAHAGKASDTNSVFADSAH
jgi:hypothetical protein